MFPYIYYGIAAWAQPAQGYLRNIFILQTRDLRLMFFAGSGSHAIPLFVSANILPLNMLYFETVCSLTHDIIRDSKLLRKIHWHCSTAIICIWTLTQLSTALSTR